MSLLGFKKKKYSLYNINTLLGFYKTLTVPTKETALAALKKIDLEVINTNKGLKLKIY